MTEAELKSDKEFEEFWALRAEAIRDDLVFKAKAKQAWDEGRSGRWKPC